MISDEQYHGMMGLVLVIEPPVANLPETEYRKVKTRVINVLLDERKQIDKMQKYLLVKT